MINLIMDRDIEKIFYLEAFKFDLVVRQKYEWALKVRELEIKSKSKIDPEVLNENKRDKLRVMDELGYLYIKGEFPEMSDMIDTIYPNFKLKYDRDSYIENFQKNK
jgi:hypothetical protein